jgi:isoleucyl-tRNA synthetase
VTLYAEPELAAKLTALGEELRFVLLTSGATVADYAAALLMLSRANCSKV